MPWGKARWSTGSDKKGPLISSRDSQSACSRATLISAKSVEFPRRPAPARER